MPAPRKAYNLFSVKFMRRTAIWPGVVFARPAAVRTTKLWIWPSRDVPDLWDAE